MKKPISTSKFILFIVCLHIGIWLPMNVSAEEWVYTTRPGDTLWDISQQYLKNVNYWARLQKHNNVDIAKQLAPGTKLKVPLAWLKDIAAPALVININGQVNHQSANSNESRILQSKQSINIGDTITTGENGSTLVQFADGSTLLIQKNSQVVFNTLSAFGKTGMVDTRVRLQQGRVNTSVKSLNNPNSRFEITTPAAIAAVRGTQFRVAYETSRQSMASEVVEGEIAVASEGVEQTIPQGFGTIAEVGKPPQPPVKLLQTPELKDLPETLRYLPVEITWPVVEGAQKYTIQLSPADNKTELLVQQTSEMAAYTITQLSDGQYILQVNAIDSLGLQGLSAEHVFSLDTAFPVVQLQSPANNTELSDDVINFSWQTEDKVAQYRLQISQDENFETLLLDELIEQSSFTHQAKSSEGQFYWRVAGLDTQGNQGQFSSKQTFSIKQNPYEALLILLYLLPAFFL